MKHPTMLNFWAVPNFHACLCARYVQHQSWFVHRLATPVLFDDTCTLFCFAICVHTHTLNINIASKAKCLSWVDNNMYKTEKHSMHNFRVILHHLLKGYWMSLFLMIYKVFHKLLIISFNFKHTLWWLKDIFLFDLMEQELGLALFLQA